MKTIFVIKSFFFSLKCLIVYITLLPTHSISSIFTSKRKTLFQFFIVTWTRLFSLPTSSLFALLLRYVSLPFCRPFCFPSYIVLIFVLFHVLCFKFLSSHLHISFLEAGKKLFICHEIAKGKLWDCLN